MKGIFPRLAALYAAALLAHGALCAGGGPVFDSNSPPLMINSDVTTIENASRALEMGMPALSAALAGKVADASSGKMRDAARIVLADSLIAQGAFEKAGEVLDAIGGDPGPDVLLRRAIVLARGGGDGAGAAELLASFSPDSLDDGARAWYFVTRGLVSFDEGNFKSAKEDFLKAKNYALSLLVAQEADILYNLCKMSEDLSAEDLASFAADLGMKSSLFIGSPSGVQYAKQYAIVLDRLGRKRDALDVIENALSISVMPDSDRDELRIIEAAVEPSNERKRAILRSLLLSTVSPRTTEQAIYLLRKTYENEPGEFDAALLSVLSGGSPLVRDRILLELAYSAMKRGAYQDVKKYAETLLKDYPASAFKSNAYGVLAWAAFAPAPGKNPEYRLAARHLMSVASLEKNPRISDFTRFLAADCYFMDGDYDTAGSMYRALLSSELPENWKGGAFTRAVESMIALGDVSGAEKLADSSYASLTLNPEDVWRAEWAISSALRQEGASERAMERVSNLLSGPVSEGADHDLRAKMLWLQARFAENSGDFGETLKLCDGILGQIRSGALKASRETADAIASNAMLIKARSLSALDRFDGPDGAFEAYAALRRDYPSSDAAQISYLYEARNFAMRGAFAKAQQNCKTLADAFPDGAYADTALYDAAAYSRKLGLPGDYREAVSLLSRLVERYPKSPKVFYAKIAQAEILRLTGDFANAAAVYRNIIDEFEGRPQAILANMGLGDCLLAQTGRESEAAATFERIYSMPDIPREARAEAAYKCGFALERVGRTREAAEVWWVSANSFLGRADAAPPASGGNSAQAPGAEVADFSPKERYWIARTLLDLARTFEQNGEKASAASAYALLIKYDLPGSRIAKSKVLNAVER